MRVTRAWRVAPAWVRELIDEIDGVKKVGAYWVNRVSGMGIRSPFTFDHVNRILRFKGFSDPIHESEIFNNSPPDPDWGVIRFNESLESINCVYYSAIDEAIASIFGSLIMRRKGAFSKLMFIFICIMNMTGMLLSKSKY